MERLRIEALLDEAERLEAKYDDAKRARDAHSADAAKADGAKALKRDLGLAAYEAGRMSAYRDALNDVLDAIRGELR